MSKLLSIITITKNDVSGLISTYESIAISDGSSNYVEWIVIDGESCDGTADYLEGLHPEFDFAYVSEIDSGIYDAMNKGAEKASGQYFLFLNSGDTLYNDSTLTSIFPYLLKNSSKIIAGTVSLRWKDIHVSGADLSPWVPHQGAFIHRTCFESRSYDNKLKFYGDLKFWMTLKKEGLFVFQRVKLEIAQFTMGGVGNNPANIFERLKERNRLSLEFKESLIKIIARTVLFTFLYFFWKVFGSRFYYKMIMKL